MKFNIKLLPLFLVILVAIFFRFYQLGSVPPQPTVDEVSLGYNAYSILNTGSDEYGTRLPVLLRAYDDYRPALYSYLAVPFVKFFGLNVVSVRLPSVVLYVLTVVAVYFLTRYLTNGIKPIQLKYLSLDVSLFASFLLAISPWHIYISRLGHEANAFLAFLMFGILFFLRFIDGKKWSLFLSAIFLALSFNSYQNGKVIIPVLIMVFFSLYFKNIVREKSKVIIALILGIIIIAPVIQASLGDNALIRFKATSLTQNSSQYYEMIAKRNVLNVENGDMLGYVYDNRKIATALLVSNAYLSHFDPVWLFMNKGGEPFKSPTLGLLYLFELPLIFISFLVLLKTPIHYKNKMFLIILGAVSILPASITTDYPHAMRTYAMLPLPQILASIGFIYLLSLIKSKSMQRSFLFFSSFVVFVSVVWFYHSYFSLMPRELSNHFQYGAISALTDARELENSYEKVVVSNREVLFESYMFYLFLNKYDPSVYQRNGGTVSGGFNEEHLIGKYVFGDIKGKLGKNRLYIINPQEVTKDMRVIKEIKYPNNTTVLIIAEII